MVRPIPKRKIRAQNQCELKGNSPCEGEVKSVASLIPDNRSAVVCAAYEKDVRWAEAMLMGRAPRLELPTVKITSEKEKISVMESLNVDDEVDKRLGGEQYSRRVVERHRL